MAILFNKADSQIATSNQVKTQNISESNKDLRCIVGYQLCIITYSMLA